MPRFHVRERTVPSLQTVVPQLDRATLWPVLRRPLDAIVKTHARHGSVELRDELLDLRRRRRDEVPGNLLESRPRQGLTLLVQVPDNETSSRKMV